MSTATVARPQSRLFAACVAVLAILVCVAPVPAHAGSFVSPKLLFAGMAGREVNVGKSGTTPAQEDLCLAGESCREGSASSLAGGFSHPTGVAIGPEPEDLIYVADERNSRVDVLTGSSAFLRMFGWKVDETTGGDVCPEKAGDVCRAGQSEPAGAAGVIAAPASVAVDPSSGNVFVWDPGANRVEEYASSGAFVLMVGRKVNKSASSAHPNLCLAGEAGECQAGEASTTSSTEPLAFKAGVHGGVLAVGGPGDLLYVGDEERVQEIEANGGWAGEIKLGSFGSGTASAMAVDSAGDVYLLYGSGGVVHFYGAADKSISSAPGELGSLSGVTALALDAFGRLAVATSKGAMLFEATNGQKLSQFSSQVGLGSVQALGFNASDVLYAADIGNQAIEWFGPDPVADTITGPVQALEGTAGTLTGEIDPEGVAETSAWFEWGLTPSLGSETVKQAICTTSCGATPVQVSERLVGLTPNETYYYRFAAEDAKEKAPEPPLIGQTLSFRTPSLAPAFPSEPEALFVGSKSVVFEGVVNPENARTKYRFIYGACEPVASCANGTPENESSVYREVPITQEVRGLLPSTTYHYRFVAANEYGQTTESPEAMFTTSPTVTLQAVTGAASAITATDALIAGEVNPDGKPASYAFELGVYNGASTQYGTVMNGPAGEGSGLIAQTLQLSGLQAGTTYAYRIKIESGYGMAIGESHTFTTAGLPAVLNIPPVLAMLPVPDIRIPAAGKATPKTLTQAQKLAAALEACRAKPKRKRANCERTARNKYGTHTKRKRNKKGKKK